MPQPAGSVPAPPELDCRLDPTAAVGLVANFGPDHPDIREEVSLYAAHPGARPLYGRTCSIPCTSASARRSVPARLRRASPHLPNNGTWGRVIGQHGGDRDGDSNAAF